MSAAMRPRCRLRGMKAVHRHIHSCDAEASPPEVIHRNVAIIGYSANFSLLYGICSTATLTSQRRHYASKNKTKTNNHLDIYRRRMRFSQRHVARLLGHKDYSAWSDYERGERLPSLANALRLGIILRMPVEFLFRRLHDELAESDPG